VTVTDVIDRTGWGIYNGGMSDEMKQNLKSLRERLTRFALSMDVEGKMQRRAEIEKQMSGPNFWKDQAGAQKTVAELKKVKSVTDPYGEMSRRFEDCEVLLQLALEEDDAEALKVLEEDVASLSRAVDEYEFKAMLSGKYDVNDAFVSIHAGAGGTESCDWAAMLFRMYARWIERKGFESRIVDSLDGDGAGYRNIMMEVNGPWACGYLKSEIGVHRLVRISPFDANARRHTSFASVDVVPKLEGDIEIEVGDSDIRVDRYRASGAGGQHVNVTDSAVRITHIQTGIVAQCQNERSQHQNYATALRVLKARLYRLEEQKREKELASLYGAKGEIAWGNQIRSYVLQPYQMVKDHRTGHETGKVQAVLDGDLDDFMEAYLLRKGASKGDAASKGRRVSDKEK